MSESQQEMQIRNSFSMDLKKLMSESEQASNSYYDLVIDRAP
jgi:hypothetical protein